MDVTNAQKDREGGGLAPTLDANVDRERPVVLVVDDDPDTRKLVSLMLADRYMVLVSENAEQALRHLERSVAFGHSASAIKVVLLDVMMPGTDGFTLCRRIVKEYGVTVMMMTARNTRADVETAIRNGARDYIVKPFDKATLLAKLSRHLYALSPG
jgi:DNA-binding response OmpR family regulator